jgi:hypothetical protein
MVPVGIDTVRTGAGSCFAGDRIDPVLDLAEHDELDYEELIAMFVSRPCSTTRDAGSGSTPRENGCARASYEADV